MRNSAWPGRMLLDGTGKRVSAHCRKCGRRLAELRGVDTVKAVAVDDHRVGYAATGGSYRFTCRCGATPRRRQATLDAEFAAASPRGRVYLS